ncbi:MAG TPA: hypothetical protein VHQ23_10935 [Ilumatobacteraceae bacterium]|nr:hypothetical protein [Ilumatobacteraceae bacterium]
MATSFAADRSVESVTPKYYRVAIGTSRPDIGAKTWGRGAV